MAPVMWGSAPDPIPHGTNPGHRITAQTANPTPQTANPPRGLRVYLITIGQGAEVWEKFGHNALWFFDDATGVDEAYNWGVFDFRQPGFLRRFLTGDTKYWVEAYPGGPLIDWYKRSDRTIVVQRLALTPAQAQRALAFSRWNARDENKFYRYDYFRDNCSTRVRDVIDYALAGTLKRVTAGVRGPGTFRSESIRLTDDLKLTQLGIYIALGQPADRSISLWQSMFIPMRMRDILRGTRVPAASGAPVPLIAEERTVYETREHHERADVPRLWIPYLVVGLLLGAEFAAVRVARRQVRWVETVYRAEVTLWAVVTGILGLVLLLAWTTTRHVFWYDNQNLLLLNPLALWLAVTVPLARKRARMAKAAYWLAAAIAVTSFVALLIRLIPSAALRQDNFALICLLLPANVAIALGLRDAVSPSAPTPTPTSPR